MNDAMKVFSFKMVGYPVQGLIMAESRDVAIGMLKRIQIGPRTIRVIDGVQVIEGSTFIVSETNKALGVSTVEIGVNEFDNEPVVEREAVSESAIGAVADETKTEETETKPVKNQEA